MTPLEMLDYNQASKICSWTAHSS